MKRLFVPGLALGVLLMGGCGGGAPAAPSPSASTAPAAAASKPAASTAASAPAEAKPSAAASTAPAQLTKIKFATGGSPPDPAFITAYIARDAGIFKKNGLDVDVQSVQGDQLVTAALVSGDIQFGEIGVAAGMAAVAQGGNLKFLVAGTPKLDALLAAKGLKDPKELQGKAFGISAPGSVSDASARLALQKLGVDISKVDFLPIGGIGNRAKAINAGQVAASGLPSLVTAQLQKTTQGVNVLASYADVLPDFMYVANMATTDYMQGHQKETAAFVKSIVEASRYLHTNQSESAQIMAKVVPEATAEDIKAAYDKLLKADAYGVDGGLAQGAYDYTEKQLEDLKALKKPITYTDGVDKQYIDQAVKELGPYKP